MKKIFTTITFLMIGAFHANAQTKVFQVDNDHTLITGLISYYKLEDATYFWGTNNGTATDITFSSGNGKVNNGGGFNGSTSKIINNNSGLGLTGNITISVWIKLVAIPPNSGDASSNTFDIVSRYDNTTGRYDLRAYQDGGVKYFNFFQAGERGGEVRYAYSAMTTGVWYHLVAIDNGTNSLLYLNGTQVASGTGGTRTSGPQPFNIGCLTLTGTPQRFFNGSIDEVGIWNRALTPAEISKLYNGTGVGSGQTMVQANNAIFFGTEF